eukprot:4800872-Pyramimonas_sp.AAC.1
MHNSLPRGLSWGDAERDRDAVEGREHPRVKQTKTFGFKSASCPNLAEHPQHLGVGMLNTDANNYTY